MARPRTLPLPRGAGPEAREGGRGDRTAGQALVEFTIGVLLFMLLTLAIIQFCILYHMRLVLAHASREGARYAAARLTTSPYTSVSTTESQVKQFIISRAGTLRPPLTEANITFLPADPSQRQSNMNIRVVLTYSARSTVPLIAPLLPPQITFTAEAGARLE